MKFDISSAAPALLLAAACLASPQAAIGAPDLHMATIQAAVRVPYATQATMLSSTRAGERIVAVGDHGVVLLSDDQGSTYRQARQVPVDVSLTSVSFADDSHGWAVGHWGVVLCTEDGGETWTLQREDRTEDRPLFAVKFLDGTHGVAVGLWSLILTTDDGGRNWRTVAPPPPEGSKRADLNLFGLFADKSGALYATAEKGMVLRSRDRGADWQYLSTGYAGSFWTGAALDDGSLIVAGLRGSMYRSADNGASWARTDTRTKSSITSISVAGREVVAVGLDGLILVSDDSGEIFRTLTLDGRVPLTSVLTTDKRVPVIYSRRGVVPAESVPKLK